jgi:hypothetical protein
MVANRSVDLSRHQAQIEFVGGAANAGLGQRVVAAAVQGGDGEVLIAAPGEGGGGVVHLVTIGHRFDTATTTVPKVLSGTAGHITFSGIRPEAMTVGDLDGDGSAPGGSEIILGDPRFDLTADGTTTTGVGAVYFLHDVDPLAATAYSLAASDATGPARVIQGTTMNQALGAALLVLNVAGHPGPDLVVGVPGDSDSRGAIRIYENRATSSPCCDRPSGPTRAPAPTNASARPWRADPRICPRAALPCRSVRPRPPRATRPARARSALSLAPRLA